MNSKIFLKWPLIIGIMIILNFFFVYAVKVVYPGKDYQDFCPRQERLEKIDNAEDCVNRGGQWNENLKYQSPEPGFCNLEYKCSEEYQNFRENYEKNVFIILIVLGAISLGASFLTGINRVLSTAFSFGGILTFIVASLRYWEFAKDWLHLLILGLALAGLVWLGMKKFKDYK